ncbi:hypothetical protein SAMN05660206_104117 [Sphingobacterium wenxiniae]|uniref:Uncharacterized protein n=2 Tax=Sphingobacterium wenxiniae TaxID=683125 RepID=A0A1I6S5E7_9SPHI|nr:hypothetical protein SAMN05660206_104117 [Sphingobacterium wenxiniae]
MSLKRMKNYFFIIVIGLASCTGQGNRVNEDVAKDIRVDTTANILSEQYKSYCFLRAEGISNEDTTMVQFTIDADQVEGSMRWIPAEKDSRKGTLVGKIVGDEITGIWKYMQEGMQDSMPVRFKLSTDRLLQKPLKVDSVTGRQETDESAGYTVVYTGGHCTDER